MQRLSSLAKSKKVIISLFSVVFILGVLVVGLSYIRQKQNIPVGAAGVQLQLVTANSSVKKGDQFNVDVYIDSMGLGVTGADLRVSYDTSKLSALSIQKADFLPVTYLPGKISGGMASIVLGSNPTEPKNGNGILATVKFKSLTGEATTISFGTETAISALNQKTNVAGSLPTLQISAGSTNPTTGPGTPIPTPVNNTCRNDGDSCTYRVCPSPPPCQGGRGCVQIMPECLAMAVGICRNGNCVPKPIGSPRVTPVATSNSSPRVTSIPRGSVGPFPTVRPVATPRPGDVNGDGKVNIDDIRIIINNYRKNRISDPRADVNHDGKVDIFDILVLVRNYDR